MHLPKLLIVDDDRHIARAMTLALRTNYEIHNAPDGEQALERIKEQSYSVIILDLNLPGISGLEVCRQLRQKGVTTPVFILSGNAQVLTKISLLDAGANDYITKPFSLGELKARLRVLIRSHIQLTPAADHLKAGGLLLNRQSHTVVREGITIRLRRKEFALLECLMEHDGAVVSRGALTRHAWQGLDEPWTNTIDVHVKYLRDKIDRPFDDPLIQTVHGLGYRIKLLKPVTPEKN